jgi:hypothetical protein
LQNWLDHPAVQSGVLPFVVALVAALALRRVGAAWLAPTIGYAASVALATGIAFVPLTAGRKVLLLALVAPLVGLAVDRSGARVARVVACVAAAVATAWAFSTVLAQRPPTEALALGIGLAAFVAALCALQLRLAEDGPAAAASGLGLGLATGVSALLSASTGYFAAGVSIAAGCGALLAIQFVAGSAIRPGALGALAVAVAVGLFAAATLALAQLPWTALALLLAVPLLASVPLPAALAFRGRVVVRTLVAVAGAALPVLAAWVAASSPPT